jgi:Ras-related protein Rab-1A
MSCCGKGKIRTKHVSSDSTVNILPTDEINGGKPKIFTNYDYLFKIILVGDSNVGKSCFLQKLIDNRFYSDSLSTIGVDFKIKIMYLDEKSVKIQIWDTAGQERYRNLTKSYYRNCNGIVIMYDVTKQVSFDNLEKWVTEIHNSGNSDIPVLLLANKCDLASSRTVNPELAQKFAQEHGYQFAEVSVKEDENLETKCLQQFVWRMIELQTKKAIQEIPTNEQDEDS